MSRTMVVLQEPMFLSMGSVADVGIAEYTQPQRHWVRVGDANAVQVTYRILAISNCALSIETGALLEAPFQTMTGLGPKSAATAGSQVVVLPDATEPLSNFLRWRVDGGTVTAGDPWSIQFEIYVTLYTA